MAWRGRIIPEVLIGVVAIHLGALLAFAPYFFTWAGVAAAVIGANVFGYAITVGYHRLFAHRSFTCSKGVERFVAVLGLICLQRGPAWWAATHRRHHHHSDTELDPHSPRPSVLWAHVGWFMFVNENTDRAILNRYAKDLMKDPFYAWIESGPAWLVFAAAFALLLFGGGVAAELLLGGPLAEAVRLGASLVVWGVFVRTVVVWHMTWSTASCSHLIGYKNYETGDESRNSWLLSLVSLGEGWGNNHHAFPQSPCLTARRGEFDQSWLVIKTLAWCGIVKVDPTSFPRWPDGERDPPPSEARP